MLLVRVETVKMLGALSKRFNRQAKTRVHLPLLPSLHGRLLLPHQKLPFRLIPAPGITNESKKLISQAFSCAELDHVAELKLSQMIFDEKLPGILDPGKGQVIICGEAVGDKVM